MLNSPCYIYNSSKYILSNSIVVYLVSYIVHIFIFFKFMSVFLQLNFNNNQLARSRYSISLTYISICSTALLANILD